MPHLDTILKWYASGVLRTPLCLSGATAPSLIEALQASAHLVDQQFVSLELVTGQAIPRFIVADPNHLGQYSLEDIGNMLALRTLLGALLPDTTRLVVLGTIALPKQWDQYLMHVSLGPLPPLLPATRLKMSTPKPVNTPKAKEVLVAAPLSGPALPGSEEGFQALQAIAKAARRNRQ